MSTRPVRRTRAAAAAAVLALGAIGSGCGGAAPAADPDTAPSSATDTPGEAASSGPSTTDQSPGAPAASGLVMKMPRLSLNAPEGWTRSPRLADFVDQAADPHSIAVLQVGDIDVIGTGEASLAEQARSTIAVGGYGTVTEPEILAPVTVNGVECYHIAGRTSDVSYVEEFGTIYDGGDISIHFEFDPDTPEAERRATIDSVLASVRWR